MREELARIDVPSISALLGELMLQGDSMRQALSFLPGFSGLPPGFVSTDFRPYLEYQTPKGNSLPYNTVSLNINFMLSGVMDPNLVTGVETLYLILAWRIAGYYGVDRLLLPWLGTPWTGSLTRRKTADEALKPSPLVP